ncbi:MAG TPA: hypothetical protein VFJ77_01225 [Gaiellaceae bacterium]|nr:hypothetical protein [Gaiellaceae bacterium]
MRRAAGALAAALAAAVLLPARADAHAGRVAPAATSYLARVTSAPAGVEAKVVDGDQRLWLRVASPHGVLVLGVRGEPYLRISARGIEANTRSATWFLNRARPLVPPREPATPPVWKRLSAGRSTSWHEDRLHAAALAAHPAGNVQLGRWLVPLVVDGRRTQVTGTLREGARPSLLWFWPLLLAAALVPALLRLREARLEAAATAALAALALAAATAARLGRELYGRPTVSGGQLALVALTCSVAAALALLRARRGWRPVADTAIGILALYQGLALLAVLRDAYVLAVLPAWAERLAAAVSIASGAALLVAVLAAGVGEETATDAEPPDDAPARGPRRRAGGLPAPRPRS